VEWLLVGISKQRRLEYNNLHNNFLKFRVRIHHSDHEDIYTFRFHKVIYNEEFLSPIMRKMYRQEPLTYAVSLLLMNVSACEPYLLTYCW
jgi:hypothetical protein